MCSLNQLEPSLVHNQFLNGGNIYDTKIRPVLAWGVCYLFCKQKITINQNKIIDLGAIKSTTLFDNIMGLIVEKKIWCSYGQVRMSFKKDDENEEFLRFCHMEEPFSNQSSESQKPVAVFA